MNSNFRKGGLFMLPFVALAIVFAIIVNAPVPALLSIGAFGFGTAIILILLGDKSKTQDTNS